MATSLAPPRSRGLAAAIFGAAPGVAASIAAPAVGAAADASGGLARVIGATIVAASMLGAIMYTAASLFVRDELARLRMESCAGPAGT
jgi:hypothetical protein